jgi:type I restriction enzyme S subunit
VIAAYLDRETGRIDALVTKKRELIERLKEKRSALISRTVTRGLPPAAAKAAGLSMNPPMKDSGHPWLDDIPQHWEVKRLKGVSTLFGRIGFRGYSTDDLVYEGEGAISMSPSNMADGVVSLDKCTWLSWEKYHESPEIQVHPEDVIMVKTGSTLGKTAFVQSVPVPMTINPQLMIFKEVRCSKRFLFYYVFSKVVQDVIPLHNTGSTIPTMTQEGIGKLPFPQPPLAEQHAIAAYLDAETAKLDALVAKVEEAVERLQEYRSAMITAAVTGKIDVRKEV